jgi:DNA helicase HerA-like ATPase
LWGKKLENAQVKTEDSSLSVEEVFCSTLPQYESLRAGVFASSGAGKTTILKTVSKWACFHHRARVVIYDPMDEFYGYLAHTRKGFLRAAKISSSITRFYEPDLLPDVLDLVNQGGNCLLIIDEADRVFPRRKDLPKEVDNVLRRGRHNNTGIIWASQRPTMCHTDLLGVSSVVVVGRLVSIADAQYVRTNYGIDIQPLYHWTALLADGKKGSLKLTAREVRQNG